MTWLKQIILFSLLECQAFQKISTEIILAPYHYLPGLSEESRIKTYRDIQEIFENKTNDTEFYCIPREMDVPYCVHPQNITVVTYVLCAIYKNYKEAEEVSTVADLHSLVAQVKMQHYIDHLLFAKCVGLVASKLTVNAHHDVIRIIRDVWTLKFPRHSLFVLEHFLTRLKINSVVTDRNYVLKVWNPLRTNITGYAVHDSRNSASNVYISEIYANQKFNNINTTNVRMAAYIPLNFLNSIVSNEDRKELRVILLFVLEDMKLRKLLDSPDNIEQFVGISIPGFCKHNYLPFLSLYDGTVNSWSSFGTNYFDSRNYSARSCILSRFLYFANGDTQHFESRKREYCLINVSMLINLRNNNLSSANDALISPRYICPNFNYFEDHAISNRTEILYQEYRKCLYNLTYCNFSIDSSNSNTSLTDLFIFTALEGRNNYTFLLELLEMALNLIATQGKACTQINFLAQYLSLFHYGGGSPLIRDSFFYFELDYNSNLGGITGFVLHNYKRQTSKDHFSWQLIFANRTEDYSSDNDVEIAVYKSDTVRFAKIEFVVIFKYVFSTERYRFSQSRILGVRCLECEAPVNLTIYLKIINDITWRRTQGYWSSVSLQDYSWTFVTITQPSNNQCDNSCDVRVYQLISNGSLPNAQIIQQVTTKLRISSQIAVYMNPLYRKIYLSHAVALNAITFVCCSFSIIGITTIFVSSVYIKHWYRKRYFTVQLSIVSIFQLAFLLLDSEAITQVVYLLFCYAILVQFSWTLMISHIQYVKLVKVFVSHELGVIKSMLTGWLVPGVIIIKGVVSYWHCLRCNWCIDNNDIFLYYVALPVSAVILHNLTIYIIIMKKIWRENYTNANTKKARWTATIILPFLFGLPWVCIFAIASQWPWLSLVGAYSFHLLVSSQGLFLFLFAVVFDKDTNEAWRRSFT